ncbi:MAG: hypothetical protein QXE78_01975 [Nitrososphaeria archaeon]
MSETFHTLHTIEVHTVEDLGKFLDVDPDDLSERIEKEISRKLEKEPYYGDVLENITENVQFSINVIDVDLELEDITTGQVLFTCVGFRVIGRIEVTTKDGDSKSIKLNVYVPVNVEVSYRKV